LVALKTPGLGKAEVLRLRGLIAGVKVYQERFAEFVCYRKIELELLEARKKYAELRKKSEGYAQKVGSLRRWSVFVQIWLLLKSWMRCRVKGLRGDVEGFFEQVFGFTPFKYQWELVELFEKNQFTAVRWARQTGKSFSVSAFF
jgi:hypothetical protein